MAIGKKGVFFTFSALLLLTVVFTSLIFQTGSRFNDDNTLISLKAENLNAFVLSLDEDLERGLFIAGFRALLAADRHIGETDSFLVDAQSNLQEAMVNGTIEGTQASMMVDSTLPEWLSRIKEEAGGVAIVINFSEFDVLVGHISPWQINFYANVSYNITDLSDTAVFRRNQLISAQVDIRGLVDPVYTIFTNGRIIRSINNTPYEGNYVSGVNTANLQAHINGLYYTNSSGPSYLMRLEGNFGSSPFGIESIVRLPDLQEQEVPVFERSAVDYVYFSNLTPSIFTINNTFEDWFRLGDAHLEKYQVENLASS